MDNNRFKHLQNELQKAMREMRELQDMLPEDTVVLAAEDISEPWYMAVSYPATPDTLPIAKGIYNKLNIMKNSIHAEFSAYNVISGTERLVIAIAPSPLPKHVVSRIEQAMPKDHRTDIPQHLQESLLERSQERRLGTLLSGKNSIEAHKPTPIASKGKEISKEEYEKHLQVVVDSLTASGLPFLEIYSAYAEMNIQQTLKIRQDAGNFSPKMAIEFYQQQVSRSDKYLFTESARMMHAAVYEENPEWIYYGDNVWIEQDIPFEARGSKIKGVYIQKMAYGTNEPSFQVFVIDHLGRHILAILVQPERNVFDPTIDYYCPDEKCEILMQPADDQGHYYVARNPCDNCRIEARFWMAWLHTAIRMLRRDFSVSPEPQAFKAKDITYKKKEIVPRHHGKGAPKEKMVEKNLHYTLVSYDVSVSQAKREVEQGTGESKENWLTLHGSEDRIYVRRDFQGQKRRYRGSHYHTLIERCLKEGVVREDGYEYKLEKDEDDNWMVIGGIADYEKYVPMLRPELRKKNVMKVVKAKQFE